MTFGWHRIAKTVWRLDDTWQVVEETPGAWRVYRGDNALLESGPLEWAFAMAEELRRRRESPTPQN